MLNKNPERHIKLLPAYLSTEGTVLSTTGMILGKNDEVPHFTSTQKSRPYEDASFVALDKRKTSHDDGIQEFFDKKVRNIKSKTSHKNMRPASNAYISTRNESMRDSVSKSVYAIKSQGNSMFDYEPIDSLESQKKKRQSKV